MLLLLSVLLSTFYKLWSFNLNLNFKPLLVYFLPDFSPPFCYKAIVTKKYKFVRGFSPRENNTPTNLQELFSNNSNISLYDLEKDPYELNNLAKDQSQNELLLKMNTKLNALMDNEVGLENHVIHLPGPDWFWTT